MVGLGRRLGRPGAAASRGETCGPVLVAGATGWVGRALLELAHESGLPVVGVARRPVGDSRVQACDVSDRDAVDRLFQRLRPSVVFNCIRVRTEEFVTAAQPRRSSGLVELGVLLDASAQCRSRLVHVGSAAEYGGSLGRRPVTERTHPRPLNLYGRQKLGQTKLALARARRGADVVVARLFNLIGPGEGLDTVTGSWIARLASARSDIGGVVEIAATVRDFVDVRDAARALLLLGAHAKARGTYNICSGRGTRIDRLVRTVAQILSVDVRIRSVVPRRERGSGPSFAVGSSRRLRGLGWVPRIPLERSIVDKVIEWCGNGD